MGNYIYLLAMIGSIITLIGSMVFLFRQKTVVDQNGAVSEVDIPFFGRLKSNYPSILMGFIGAALAAYTLGKVSPEIATINLLAKVGVADTSNTNNLPFFVGVVPQEYFKSATLGAGGKSTLNFVVEGNKSYNVVVLKPVEVTPEGVRFLSVHGPALLEQDKLSFEGILN